MDVASPSQQKRQKAQRDASADLTQAATGGRRWLKRGPWVALAVALLFAAYLLAGYYAVPAILRQEADSWAHDTLKKPIRVGDVRFDPLRFTLDVRDLAVPDGPRPMLAADNIHVGFSVLSLLSGPYDVTEVRLERPVVRAVIRPDGSLNLADLVPKPKKPSKPPAVRIGTFSVARGQLIFADDSLPDRPEIKLSPVAFTLKNFQTNSTASGAFTLKARSELGEGFAWSGTVSAAPIHSRGRIQVSALRARTIASFLGPAAPANLRDGLLDFTTSYDFRYGAARFDADLSGASLDVTGLKVAGGPLPAGDSANVDRVQVRLDREHVTFSPGRGADIQATLPSATADGIVLTAPGQPLRIKSVSLTGVRVGTAARQLQADALSVDGADLRVRREANGQLSLASLLSPSRPTPAPAAQPPWRFHLASFAVNRASLEFDDQAVTPAFHTLVSPIDLTLTDIDSDLSKPIALRLSARMGGAKVEASGSATPSSTTGDLKVALSNLPLKPLLPYGPQLHDADLTSGDLSVSGELRFKGTDAKAVRFDGQASIDKVSVRQPSTNGLLVSWDSFRLEGLRYASGQTTVREGVLTGPVARVVLMPDRTLNLAAVAGPAPTPTSAQVTPVAATKPSAGAAAPATPLVMQKLTVSGGSMEFADLSIDPNFQARIDALQGSLTNVSTKPGAVADIDLSGQVVDRFSPVSIKGSIDLLAFDQQTDVHLAFHNIELPIFNPYSGRYAGYAIAKGKLTTELSYKIDNRKLVANHHIVIDQLEWGQATESKEKAPFPIRLATSLLKDKNGVITLDVPVTGTLDDPQFNLGSIVGKIIGNTLTKVATAPFRMIGSLFHGSEKAHFIDFEPGSAALPPDASQSLGALAKAMAQKKELNLDIPAGPGLDADATALADQRIDAAMTAQKKGAPTSLSALSPDEQVKRMKALYQAQFHKAPAFPAPVTSQGAAAAKPSPEQRQTQELAWMRDQLRPAFAGSKADLDQLGAARAQAVRDALLADNSLDPTRVFVTSQETATSADGHIRLELKIK